jgi:acyl-CoA thioester hydrolase
MDYPIVVTFPVHWGDLDAFGHVNNARYFTWFESARVAYFRGIDLVMDRPSALGPIIASGTCDYLRPVTYPMNLAVGARVTSIGNTSFSMAYGLWQVDEPGKLYARGTSVVVAFDYAAMKKVRVPEQIRAAIARLQPELGTDAG